MREELRASLLKIYFLKLREVRGEAAARDVFVAAGLDPSWIEQETAWVSVEATRRALVAIGDELGAQSLHEVASFVGHAEALGPWVRMVREAKQPIDAYRYIGAHVQEQTRVGEYDVEEPGVPAKPSMPPSEGPKLDAESTQPAPAIPDKPTAPPRNAPRVRFTYKPRPDEPTETDDLLCTVREQQLSGLTTLWGLPPARVEHEACLAKGGDCCKYALRWDDEPPIAKRAPLLGLVAAVVAFALIFFFHWIAAIIAAVIAGALGYGMGTLFARQRRLERDRAFERTRIATLERGLELRGDVATVAPGDLVGTSLGGREIPYRKAHRLRRHRRRARRGAHRPRHAGRDQSLARRGGEGRQRDRAPPSRGAGRERARSPQRGEGARSRSAPRRIDLRGDGALARSIARREAPQRGTDRARVRHQGLSPGLQRARRGARSRRGAP
jgi:hypothetical protein